MLQVSKAATKKAKKQQKAAMQLTASKEASPPDVSSAMDGASSAPATTSGAQLQVCPLTNLALIISCASAGHCSVYFNAETVCLCSAPE